MFLYIDNFMGLLIWFKNKRNLNIFVVKGISSMMDIPNSNGAFKKKKHKF